MNRMACLTAFTLAVVVATPAFSETEQVSRGTSFASDYQTVPVVANTTGVGGATFQTSVSLLNPTSSSFVVEATFYDAAGTKHQATISLAAGELKSYPNFLDSVFHITGAGAVTLKSVTGTNRFVVNAEIWTGTTNRYGTSVPVLEFAGSDSRSFSAGITVDTNTRTNIGCFNQSDTANFVKATILDSTGDLTLGTVNLPLAANGWGQTSVTTIVSGGQVQFDPQGAAVCYAVVVRNSTNDGHLISAAEYTP